jgi:hypothetical protein
MKQANEKINLRPISKSSAMAMMTSKLMAHSHADDLRGRVFVFLLKLRDSGVVNMFGAAPYLEEEFDFDRKEANDWLAKWMRSL